MKKDARSAIVAQMHKRLDRAFGGEAWDQTRTPSEPLDNLMRTILSQNTTDENRDRAFDLLKKKYPAWEQVMKAPIEDVKEAIKVAGLANQKGPAMQGFLTWLWQEKKSLSLDFIREMDEDDAVLLLTQHKGIGIKTAYIVLAFACNKDLCAVDTHVHRIVKRVGLIDETCGREKAHRELRPLIPKGKARAFHVNLLDLGKTICHARGPNCGGCMIVDLCAYGKTIHTSIPLTD